MRKIDTIVIHCSATPEGMTYPLESLRADHKKRGFVDVGYHYYIRRMARYKRVDQSTRQERTHKVITPILSAFVTRVD